MHDNCRCRIFLGPNGRYVCSFRVGICTNCPCKSVRTGFPECITYSCVFDCCFRGFRGMGKLQTQEWKTRVETVASVEASGFSDRPCWPSLCRIGRLFPVSRLQCISTILTIYRVAQNKPGLFTFVIQVLYFYNNTRKYDSVRVAPKTLVKAVLSVSSTGCNNERQIDNRLPKCPTA